MLVLISTRNKNDDVPERGDSIPCVTQEHLLSLYGSVLQASQG